MTNKKFIVLNLLFTVACILVLAFSNGILSFDKTSKPELIQKEKSLPKDTVSASEKIVYILGEKNMLEENNYADGVHYCH